MGRVFNGLITSNGARAGRGTLAHMQDTYLNRTRLTPVHAPAISKSQQENTAQSNYMQQPAEGHSDVQVQSPVEVDEYTISVDQVREHFKSRGLSKSKDTVQRWCRQGDLDCQKRGVFGRYFTTETSLKKLETKLLPDMIAEGAGAKLEAQPVVDERSDVQVHAAANAGASSGKSGQMQEDAAARSSVRLDTVDAQAQEVATVAELKATITGLKGQLEQVQEVNTFLKEEIVSSRGQRGDVVKIAEQMLGTLETIAIGGRLERRSPSSPNASVSHSQAEPSGRNAVEEQTNSYQQPEVGSDRV